MSAIQNIIRKKISSKSKEILALCCFYDNIFDGELSDMVKLVGINKYVYPANINIKHKNIEIIKPSDINDYTYDFIIFNDLIKQNNEIIQLTKSLHLPGLVISHEQYNETQYHLKQRLKQANIELISMNYLDNQTYGVETVDIEKKFPVIMDGSFQEKDYGFIRFLKTEIPELMLLGNNPGLDFSISPKTYEEYKYYIQSSKILLHLPLQQNIQYSVLLAMASGSLVITTENPWTQKLFKDGCGVLCKHPREFVQQYKIPRKDNKEEIMKKVDRDFNINKYRDFWKNTIDKLCKKVYIDE